jgi:hypothetical protein
VIKKATLGLGGSFWFTSDYWFSALLPDLYFFGLPNPNEALKDENRN